MSLRDPKETMDDRQKLGFAVHRAGRRLKMRNWSDFWPSASCCGRWRGGSVRGNPWHAYRVFPLSPERSREASLDSVNLTMLVGQLAAREPA
jgi:hypothetical protein